MVPEKTVQLADECVSWKVPTLFDNDWVGLSLARALNPLLPKPLFSTAYGCPACAWAGGRHAWVHQAAKQTNPAIVFFAIAGYEFIPLLSQ